MGMQAKKIIRRFHQQNILRKHTIKKYENTLDILNAYHSDILLINGANSNMPGSALSVPLLTAINRTLSLRNISIAFPTCK